jgi:hypothetical protein
MADAHSKTLVVAQCGLEETSGKKYRCGLTKEQL